ncbi:folate family ECF transporter S component [Helcococcus ovis]|nr:folate family ECF transporter S component [Helcococcus ovis]
MYGTHILICLILYYIRSIYMKSKFNLQSFIMATLLTAISIILTRFLSFYLTPNMRIGIGSLPIIFSGAVLGPFLGALTGVAADLIGIMINPGGVPHLGFTLSSTLTGLIPGIIFFIIFNKNNENQNLKILLTNLFIFGFIHLILNSIWLSQLSGLSIWFLIISRLPKILIESVFTGILLKLLLNKKVTLLLNQ